MIFYFSGTGNSLWVAKILGEYQKEQVVSITDQIQKEQYPFCISLKSDEKLGFVFPIYAWAPPKIVMDFIRNLEIKNYNGQYIFAVCTCGDTAGHAMNMLQATLNQKNMKLGSGFSVFMPNNYIISFDVDSKEVATEKLEQAKQTIGHINEVISQKRNGVFDSYEGSVPFIRTQIINPLFNAFALSAKKFYAKGNCISCGLCEHVCPTKNIRLENGSPKWGKQCTKCLACIHRCPVQAIQYAKVTENKGRYYNPHV